MGDYNDGIVKKTKLSGYIKENITIAGVRKYNSAIEYNLFHDTIFDNPILKFIADCIIILYNEICFSNGKLLTIFSFNIKKSTNLKSTLNLEFKLFNFNLLQMFK
jgi:hypothetical protein